MLFNALALSAVVSTGLLTSSVPQQSGEKLERALATISIPEISGDIFFLASDELGGRDSPSVGQRIAARYIRSRLVRLGFQPGAPGGYFYDYSLNQFSLNEDKTFAMVHCGDGSLPWKFGKDYYVSLSARASRNNSGPVVFLGSFDEDELEGVDLKGKWGLMAPGAKVSRKRNRYADEVGLMGLIVPFDPESTKTAEEMFGRWATLMRKPSMNAPRTYGVPVLYLAEGVGADWFADGMPELGASTGDVFEEAYSFGEDDGIALENVCGIWPGSDPTLKNEVIILSAHYDHVGQRDNGDIYNGADDNGSGTTGLLAVAEALTEYGPMRRTVMLMWVSAEEKGLLGSKAWTENPWLPEGMRPICDINIDMIGRNAPDAIGVTPTSRHPEYNRLTQLVEKHCKTEGFTKLNSADAYWSRSDHANFARNLKIPVAFLFSDVHEDYHKPTDTADKIDLDKLSRVVRMVVRILDDLQEDELNLRIEN